jgi:hypothetical protein
MLFSFSCLPPHPPPAPFLTQPNNPRSSITENMDMDMDDEPRTAAGGRAQKRSKAKTSGILSRLSGKPKPLGAQISTSFSSSSASSAKPYNRKAKSSGSDFQVTS